MDQDESYEKTALSDCSWSEVHITINFRRDSESDGAQPLPASEALLVVDWRCTARLDGYVDRLQIESRYEEAFCSGGLRGGAAYGAISRNSLGVLTESRSHMTEKYEEIYITNLWLNIERNHKFHGRQNKHIYRKD
jgi:hypothetical protein